MQSLVVFVLAAIVVVNGAQVEEKQRTETEQRKGPLGILGTEKHESTVEKHERDAGRFGYFRKGIDEYLAKNPLTKRDRECFAGNFKPGQSIDFVIDVAASPSQDKLDKLCADSPIGLFLEPFYREPSRAYFNAIQFFIDVVTLDMKPEWTHSVIYDAKTHQKVFIRGRGVEDVETCDKLRSSGEFIDAARNLKTLWPVCTKESVSNLAWIVKNNLGRMTKLALWNRDNGLPTVLSSTRRSKPVYSIVLTDGSSGAKLSELVDDLSRTTVIDIGNHRFTDRLSWDEVRRIAGTYALVAPQQLPFMFDSIRMMACRCLQNVA